MKLILNLRNTASPWPDRPSPQPLHSSLPQGWWRFETAWSSYWAKTPCVSKRKDRIGELQTVPCWFLWSFQVNFWFVGVEATLMHILLCAKYIILMYLIDLLYMIVSYGQRCAFVYESFHKISVLIVASTLAIQPLACQLNHFPLLVPRSGRGTQFEGTLLRNSSTSRLKACHHEGIHSNFHCDAIDLGHAMMRTYTLRM